MTACLFAYALAAAATALAALSFFRAGPRPPEPPASDPTVGRPARVVQAEPGGLAGRAIVNGELWNFEAAEPLAPGDEAVVDSLARLRLRISKPKAAK